MRIKIKGNINDPLSISVVDADTGDKIPAYRFEVAASVDPDVIGKLILYMKLTDVELDIEGEAEIIEE